MGFHEQNERWSSGETTKQDLTVHNYYMPIDLALHSQQNFHGGKLHD